MASLAFELLAAAGWVVSPHEDGWIAKRGNQAAWGRDPAELVQRVRKLKHDTEWALRKEKGAR